MLFECGDKFFTLVTFAKWTFLQSLQYLYIPRIFHHIPQPSLSASSCKFHVIYTQFTYVMTPEQLRFAEEGHGTPLKAPRTAKSLLLTATFKPNCYRKLCLCVCIAVSNYNVTNKYVGEAQTGVRVIQCSAVYSLLGVEAVTTAGESWLFCHSEGGKNCIDTTFTRIVHINTLTTI